MSNENVVPPFAEPAGEPKWAELVKCSGDGIANTKCKTPFHEVTKWGATYSEWTCRVCGGAGRNTWD